MSEIATTTTSSSNFDQITEEGDIKVSIDYAPAKGKRSPCYSPLCQKIIERGHLRIKEEYPYSSEGDTIHRYHFECYTYSVVLSNLEGLDKLKEEDKKRTILKFSNPNDNQKSSLKNQEEDDEEKVGADKGKEKEIEKGHQEEKEKEDVDKKDILIYSPETHSEEKEESIPVFRKYKNGTRVIAKTHGNIARKIWFHGKISNFRISPLGLPEYQITFLEDNVKDTKEWLSERFICPPVNDDFDISPNLLSPGTMALGWRRKPGSSDISCGWWYSVKILKYLSDVPGAYVHWVDFPFPDSILEASKIHLLVIPELPPTKGQKRQISDESEQVLKKEKLAT